ncbi:MAG TPA: hypothetical protein VKQ36_17500 [Ktedonobacterales bacterium]|nr:hypothetical protein [Ktedonobacterales bacterium]
MVKSALEFTGRLAGAVIGIIGAIVALIITIVHFTISAIQNGLGSAHTPTGIGMTILALIGALIAVFFPRTSSVLMLIAGIVMIFVAGLAGIIPLVILAIAAVVVFLDRHPKQRAA